MTKHVDLGAPEDLEEVEGINSVPAGPLEADPSWPEPLRRAVRAYNSAYIKGASDEELGDGLEWLEKVAKEYGVTL